MSKRDYIRTKVSQDVWSIFRKVYEINHPNPSSEKQEELLLEMSNYVYEKFATQLSKEKLKAIFGDK